MATMNHNSDQYGTITLNSGMHILVVINSSPNGLNLKLINKKEIMPVTGNPASYPGIVMSWVLKEHIQLPLY